MTFENEPGLGQPLEWAEQSLNTANIERATAAYLEHLDGIQGPTLQGKLEHKLDAKEAMMKGDNGSNTYEEWKCLGDFFLLNEGSISAEVSAFMRENGIDIFAEEVAELHIPTQDVGHNKLQRGLQRLSEYALSTDRNAGRPSLRFVYGITYLPADKFGFKKVTLPPQAQCISAAKSVLEKMKTQVEQDIAHAQSELDTHDETARAKILQITSQPDGKRESLSASISRLNRRRNTLIKYQESDIALYYLPVTDLKKHMPPMH